MWSKILSEIDMVSKSLQNPSLNVILCLEAVNNLQHFVTNFRSEEIYKDIIKQAYTLGTSAGFEIEFSEKFGRRRKIKKKV